jgi:hypothetical protein
MKKLLPVAVMLGLITAAQAAPLTPEICTYLNPTTGVCGGAGLAFNATTSTVIVDGVVYSGEGFPQSHEYVQSPFYADDGSLVFLSAHLTYHVKYISSGRAHYYKHWWTLDSGTVQR